MSDQVADTSENPPARPYSSPGSVAVKEGKTRDIHADLAKAERAEATQIRTEKIGRAHFPTSTARSGR